MLSCKEVVAQASEYVDREMSLSQRLSFRMHLLICHHCRRFVKQFHSGIEMVRHLHRAEVEPARIEAVITRIKTLDP